MIDINYITTIDMMSLSLSIFSVAYVVCQMI